MSRLEDLMKKMCPNGVHFHALASICVSLRKDTLTTDKLIENGKYPVINSGRTFYGFYNDYNNEGNAITVAARGEYAAFVNYAPTRFWAGGLCYPLRSRDERLVKTKFLFYYLKNLESFMRHTLVAEGGIPALNKADLMKIKIPVPPLEVQDEIVSILDNFTELTSVLAKELVERKKQYEYYRDELLTFNDSIPVIPFGDLATIQRGASPRPINNFLTDDEDGVNWIKIGDVEQGTKYVTHSKEKITKQGAEHSRFVRKGDFILSNSMSFGRPYILAIDGCIHDGWLSISNFNDSFIPDFLYHLLSSTKIQNEMKKRASFGGAVQNLNADIVRALELPVPSIELQKSIVRILDKFDAFCTSVSDGLPKEINMRQQQYEYYRNLLLSFKECR